MVMMMMMMMMVMVKLMMMKHTQVVEVGLHQEKQLVCRMKWAGLLDFRWVCLIVFLFVCFLKIDFCSFLTFLFVRLFGDDDDGPCLMTNMMTSHQVIVGRDLGQTVDFASSQFSQVTPIKMMMIFTMIAMMMMMMMTKMMTTVMMMLQLVTMMN